MEFLTITILSYTFLSLYFFFMFLLLHIRNKHKLFESPKPLKQYDLTVLVPAYNEEDSIKATIESILASNYPGLKKIIIINDGSKDNTKSIAEELKKKDSRVFVLNKKNSGKADSLNVALKLTDTELFAVIDADSYPEESAFSNMVGFFNDPKMGAVSSCILVKNKDKLIYKIQTFEYDIIVWTRKLLDFVSGVFVAPGALSVYRTNAVKNLGGFDPKNITEDIEITWHLLHEGYKTGMALKSVSYTEVPSSFKALWKQRTRWGMGGLQTLFKYRKDIFKRGSFGFFILPFVAFTILLSYFSIFLFLFFFLRGLIQNYLLTKYSLQSHTFLVNVLNWDMTPSVLFFIGVSLFLCSLWFFLLGLKLIDYKQLKKENILNMAFYILIYSGIYPIVWIGSAYKILRKNKEW